MYSTSLSRDELIKSALSAIQDLDFIFKRSTDNPFEKNIKHLLPVVSRPLDHIRNVAMALDNLSMKQFNRNEHFGHNTAHPNTGAPFPNFFTPPPNMFNPNQNLNMPNMHMSPPPHMSIHNTFIPHAHMVPPPPPRGFNVDGPYPQMFPQQNPNLPPWALQPGPSVVNTSVPPLATSLIHDFNNKDYPESLLTVIKSLKDDPKAVGAVSFLVGQMFPVQDFRLDPTLRLLTANIQGQRRFNFSEEELKEILQAIEAYLEQWASALNGQEVQPLPQLELEDWKAIVEACDAEINIITGMRLPIKKLILIIAKSKVFACEKFDLGRYVLSAFLSDNPQPLMELKEIAKQVIANWSKESDPSHKPIDVKETPNARNSFLIFNITNLRNVIATIDNIFNGGQNDDGGPKLTMIEHAAQVNDLLKSVNHWATSEMGTKFDPRTLVVQCPADWPKVQIHVNNELHRLLTNHLESVCNPNRVSHLTPSDWERIEKAAENIDLMKKHKYDLRFILLKAIDKDFIGNNQDSNSQRIYAFHRLLNNFVFFFGNDEENFVLFKSLVSKD